MGGEHAPEPCRGTSLQSEGEIDSLRDQAERCRRLASVTYNREISQMLDNMAHDFERSVGELKGNRQA
jgi:hypothetical protein